jgi:hypothetical protein
MVLVRRRTPLIVVSLLKFSKVMMMEMKIAMESQMKMTIRFHVCGTRRGVEENANRSIKQRDVLIELK